VGLRKMYRKVGRCMFLFVLVFCVIVEREKPEMCDFLRREPREKKEEIR